MTRPGRRQKPPQLVVAAKTATVMPAARTVVRTAVVDPVAVVVPTMASRGAVVAASGDVSHGRHVRAGRGGERRQVPTTIRGQPGRQRWLPCQAGEPLVPLPGQAEHDRVRQVLAVGGPRVGRRGLESAQVGPEGLESGEQVAGGIGPVIEPAAPDGQAAEVVIHTGHRPHPAGSGGQRGQPGLALPAEQPAEQGLFVAQQAAGDWTGYVPAQATPHSFDPASGIIVTANSRTIGLDYPYYLGYCWAPPYRTRRIHDLLESSPILGIQDFLHIQGDTYSIPDAAFASMIVEMARPLAAGSPDWTKIQAEFEGWDGMLNADSHIAPRAVTMRAIFQSRILTAALGPDLAKIYRWPGSDTLTYRIVTTRPKEWLPKEFDSYQALVLDCYKEMVQQLRKKLGDHELDWTWGQLVQVHFPHPLASAPMVGSQFVIPPFPQNGGPPTVNRGSSVSMRLVADPTDWDKTRQGIGLGESGDPKSPHWKDQLADWQHVTPRAFPYTEAAVSKATQSTLVLSP